MARSDVLTRDGCGNHRARVQLVELCAIPVEQPPAVFRIALDNDVADARFDVRGTAQLNRGILAWCDLADM